MNILTFDIEDWFQLLDNPTTTTPTHWANFETRIHKNVDLLLETVVRHNYKATFFCIGWIAQQYPEIIRQIDALGFEVASHSHLHQLSFTLSPKQFRQDVERSIHTLEDITGKKVKSFRAPGFSIIPGMAWAFEILIELGIEYDSSIFPAPRAHGGFADFGAARPVLIQCASGTIKEFPISVGTLLGKRFVFSGGGYFRLLPYPIIQHLTRQSDYLMTYFHPRDFDFNQPILELPLVRRFKSYIGLKGAYAKFDRWLTENEFIDMASASTHIDWELVSRISIYDSQLTD